MVTTTANSTELKDIKPVLCSYIKEAKLMLDPMKAPDDKTVHDVRVLMKKSRATLKLFKTIMDIESYTREYNTLREVGRIMRSWRESTVHRKLLKSLKKKYPAVFKNLSDDVRINLLLNKQEPGDQPVSDKTDDLKTITILLHKSLYRIRFMSIGNPDPNLIFSELEKTYSYVSQCFLRARNYPKSINIHEFRKKVKDFLYQLLFFRSLNPKTVKSIEKRIDLLGKSLGKYNDYAVLINTLDYKYKPGVNSDAFDNLVLVMKQEQDRQLLKIWPSAYRIFRPGTKMSDVLQLKTLLGKNNV